LPYTLNAPTYSFYPDKALKEISGIDIDLETNKLYAIQDEEGILYEIDTTGAILNEYDIGNEGDYEGLEINNQKAYITESNGVVTVFDLATKEKLMKLKNNLYDKNDIEGIASDDEGNLLLVCKKKSLEEDEKKGVKHIYKASSKKDGDVSMYFGIDIAEIAQLDQLRLQKNKIIHMIVRGRLSNHSPSGMDRHPNGELYILSSRSGMVTILENDQRIKGSFFTRKAINVQPEGICFDNKGIMYVANEARGRRAVVNVYFPKNN